MVDFFLQNVLARTKDVSKKAQRLDLLPTIMPNIEL
jgi:hypothetical protein